MFALFPVGGGKIRLSRSPPTSEGLIFYSDKTMISISRAKKILGKSGEKLSDEQMDLMIRQCYALAGVMFEHFKFTEKMKGVKNKDGES